MIISTSTKEAPILGCFFVRQGDGSCKEETIANELKNISGGVKTLDGFYAPDPEGDRDWIEDYDFGDYISYKLPSNYSSVEILLNGRKYVVTKKQFDDKDLKYDKLTQISTLFYALDSPSVLVWEEDFKNTPGIQLDKGLYIVKGQLSTDFDEHGTSLIADKGYPEYNIISIFTLYNAKYTKLSGIKVFVQ